ncbi:proton-conducting transporter transmembrane domain-containing protein [Paraburkholderia lycopersici]|uniref:Formate hydrogenlyase subunit 3/Multisubunit Na+/H+ antiporter, MnhD subunit n=1 Tax=Paraburkholderia lycopersici TaxID=416944 RepID=A0A1G6QMZ0_9BURK|nr:proton-conducting transporter membrane subunit [Paraburkholderia lycopersici]SDC93683.1 Formate hydrogenlyase subunit 3/Multisubunit Na+/H+ antiporter, MnhD subunit [Paraburkholderia lycopersici]
MSANLLFGLAAATWILAACLAPPHACRGAARALLGLGCALGIVACLTALPDGTPVRSLPVELAGQPVAFGMEPAGLWLMGFGLVPAAFACWLGSPLSGRSGRWHAGAAFSLLGALGVFGLQDGAALLAAWESMSLGGALMLMGERAAEREGRPVMLMLALLEVGAVALMFAVVLLGEAAGEIRFASFAAHAASSGNLVSWLAGIAFLIGFGAKLGLLPFYEWFPRAYASGSGATGALFSGVVLNAAYFALSRAWNGWLDVSAQSGTAFGLGVIAIALGVASAILAVLFAFQQDDWRALLSYSSAENASVAVVMLGVTQLFRASQLGDLAGLAWTVALLHLAGHALAKGALFLAADGVFAACGSYDIVPRGWLRRSGFLLGVGAVFSVMSLASVPPQAGFVSEWYVFQTVFQGFHLTSFIGRLVLVLAGAGLALAAAVALATFVKLFGLGLQGLPDVEVTRPVPRASATAVGVLGLCVLAVAVGAPLWLNALARGAQALFHVDIPRAMVAGWLLVPLTDKFAFISPSKLILAMPLLALLPLALLWLTSKRAVRRVPVWFGGMTAHERDAMTTALTFSNAMRTFYSFVYQPTISATREHEQREYFVKRLVFSSGVTDLFERHLFEPAIRFVNVCAQRLRALQSGNLNFYLALIGALLVAILFLTLL